MELIRNALHKTKPGFGEIRLRVDRLTLAKRRWRGAADDGCEFGFDLDEPLGDGAAFFENEEQRYSIAQNPEPVLELRIADWLARPPTTASPSLHLGLRKVAEIAWKIGNLHFPIEIADETICVADDPSLRRLFERDGLKYESVERVFHPLTGSSAHGHEH